MKKYVLTNLKNNQSLEFSTHDTRDAARLFCALVDCISNVETKLSNYEGISQAEKILVLTNSIFSPYVILERKKAVTENEKD